MRLAIFCELENEIMPIDYRRKIVSLFKYSIFNYDKNLYESMYSKSENKQKDFCFSVYFPDSKVESDKLIINSKKLIINFSTENLELGINIYNSLINQQRKLFDLSTYNKILITNIVLRKEKIITRNKVQFKTLSPIVIRDHDVTTGKDWFLTFEDENYTQILKRNLRKELADKFGRNVESDINDLKIVNINMKKIIVKSYEINIACSLGNFIIEGEQYLLNYFYKSGLGSKRGLGFSLLEVVQ